MSVNNDRIRLCGYGLNDAIVYSIILTDMNFKTIQMPKVILPKKFVTKK